jgi:hypothetical protein
MSVAVIQIFKLKNEEFQTHQYHGNFATMTFTVF